VELLMTPEGKAEAVMMDGYCLQMPGSGPAAELLPDAS